MGDNNLTINGRNIEVIHEDVDIFKLQFYPENPRINYILSKYGNQLTQPIIEENLWAQDSIKELAEDIKRNGGLIEEVVVYKDRVVEGNSRLCAYRKIFAAAPQEEKHLWSKIKCKVIVDNIEERELSFLLGQYHLNGKTPWDPFEKASYINKMLSSDMYTEKDVATNFGMRESSIRVQNKAYKLMKELYLPKITDVEDEKNELKKFSIFEEYYKSGPLQKIVNESPDLLDDDIIVDWVREGRVRSAVFDVRKELPKILSNKEARKVFATENPDYAMGEALRIVNKDHPEYADDFYKTMKDMTKLLSEAKIKDISEEIDINGSSRQIVKQFKSTYDKFFNNLNKYNKH